MIVKTYTYLALGDSYTIGEAVSLDESFPYQLVQSLRKTGHNFTAPEIIAKTGWTTDDLKKGIRKHVFLTSYDFVTLLIGVNNQYRGLDINEYALHFEQLLKQAIAFAGGENRHVFVLSVPDWSVSPFAGGKDQAAITQEISKYNLVNKNIAEEYKVQYINITLNNNSALLDEASFADDNLHPSGREYSRWAQMVAEEIQSLIVYDKQEY
jgi:lysophospholipase L1-like esterase